MADIRSGKNRKTFPDRWRNSLEMKNKLRSISSIHPSLSPFSCRFRQTHQISVTFSKDPRLLKDTRETKFAWIKFDWRRLYFSIKQRYTLWSLRSIPQKPLSSSNPERWETEKLSGRTFREGFEASRWEWQMNFWFCEWNFRISEQKALQVRHRKLISIGERWTLFTFPQITRKIIAEEKSVETFLARFQGIALMWRRSEREIGVNAESGKRENHFRKGWKWIN